MKGTVLGERYELMEKIGEGGMALVYRAHCRILDRTVAVKILKEEFSSDRTFVEKFRTEALAVAQLSHPNIVNIYDVGQAGEIYYIVMEYVEGKTLNEIINERAPLAFEEAIDISTMICDGLHQAHEKGIIHRDVKPHNILMTDSGIVKVADFGIAQAINKKTITFGGEIIGSVHYLSPEQAKGEPVSRATDIYSLGCVLYEMLTGQVPFDAESPVTVALKHIHDDPISPRSINNNIPLVLEEIVLQAMEKFPEDRFATAEEMRDSLITLHNERVSKYSNRNRNGKTMVMPPISGSENRKIKKRRLRPAGIATIIIAFLGLLSGSIFVLGDSFFGEETVVPKLTGMTSKEAREELKNSNLLMFITEEFNDEVEIDKVISQDPAEGQRVKEGREITVIISKGSQLQKVPEVRGLTLSDAELRLNSEGLEVGKTERYYDDKHEENVVFSQDPQAGSRVELHSAVNLSISKGKTPKKVSMPDLIGLDLEKANKIIRDNNLLPGGIDRKESTEYYANQVIFQDTDPEVLIAEQSSVNLIVSDGPGPVAKTRTIEFQLPDQQDYYEVVVTLKDAKGEKKIYNERRPAGESIYLGVSYFGTAKVEVQLNGEHFDTISL